MLFSCSERKEVTDQLPVADSNVKSSEIISGSSQQESAVQNEAGTLSEHIIFERETPGKLKSRYVDSQNKTVEIYDNAVREVAIYLAKPERVKIMELFESLKKGSAINASRADSNYTLIMYVFDKNDPSAFTDSEKPGESIKLSKNLVCTLIYNFENNFFNENCSGKVK